MHNKFKTWAYWLILFLATQVAYAAAFIATVEENKITFGQRIQLKLLLEDASATAPLDLSPLAKDFTIYGQQQFSAYSNTNGTIRSEFGWHVVLMPKNPGEFVLPAVGIETNRGYLQTDPIKVSVQQAGGSKGSTDPMGISLVSTVNKTQTYVNEPVICVLKIISYKPIANVVLDDIKSNDAIVEKIGEPRQYDQTHGGVRAHIIEIKYAVTALKPGKITIAPATMHGELQVSMHTPNTQRFGLFNNMFMDNMVELKPFSLQSEAIKLEVLAPAVKGNNWLPLNGLTLTQNWDVPPEVKVGDTITRKVKIVAKGGFAKQLPSVKDSMPQDRVKIYANKPNFNESFDANTDTIIGLREEEYSIVPQAAGSITFPEIKIKWWNLRTKKLEVATLPARTIKVLPAIATAGTGVTLDYSMEDNPQTIVAPQIATSAKPVLLYTIIGVLVGIIISLGLVLLFVLLKKKATIKGKLFKRKNKEPAIAIRDINDLRKFILQYANKYWQVPTGTTFNRLADALAQNNFSYAIELYTTLSEHINAGIYAANSEVGLESLLLQWEEFRKSVVRNKNNTMHSKAESEDYSSLNPT